MQRSPFLTGLFVLFALWGVIPRAAGQLTAYSLKLGPTMAFQRWNSFDQGPRFGYHLDLQIEEMTRAGTSLYASLGYHERGSAIRTRSVRFTDPRNMREVRLAAQKTSFLFGNAVLVLGAKKPVEVLRRSGFVGLGVRGERSMRTQFAPERERANLVQAFGASYPSDGFVQRWLYGIDLSAGLDIPLGTRLDLVAEVRLSPDLSSQYFQPTLDFYDPVAGGNRTAPERRIRNVSFEFSLGLRWWRDELATEPAE